MKYKLLKLVKGYIRFVGGCIAPCSQGFVPPWIACFNLIRPIMFPPWFFVAPSFPVTAEPLRYTDPHVIHLEWGLFLQDVYCLHRLFDYVWNFLVETVRFLNSETGEI